MFDKAEERSGELEKSFDLLDKWKKRGDELLYSMIPKTVAEKLRTGTSSLSTCEVRILYFHAHSPIDSINYPRTYTT